MGYLARGGGQSGQDTGGHFRQAPVLIIELLANGSEHWPQVKASWALSGITLDDQGAEYAGRIIAGDMTLDEVCQAILRRNNIQETDSSNLVDCRN